MWLTHSSNSGNQKAILILLQRLYLFVFHRLLYKALPSDSHFLFSMELKDILRFAKTKASKIGFLQNHERGACLPNRGSRLNWKGQPATLQEGGLSCSLPVDWETMMWMSSETVPVTDTVFGHTPLKMAAPKFFIPLPDPSHWNFFFFLLFA